MVLRVSKIVLSKKLVSKDLSAVWGSKGRRWRLDPWGRGS